MKLLRVVTMLVLLSFGAKSLACGTPVDLGADTKSKESTKSISSAKRNSTISSTGRR